MLSGGSNRYDGPLRLPAQRPPLHGRESRDPSPRWGSRLAPCSVSTCHAPYPGERSPLPRSVAPARSSGLPGSHGRSALTIYFRGLLGLHSRCGPLTRRPTHGGPWSRGLQRFGRPPRRLGSYWGAPTIPQTGLSPARTQHLATAHMRRVQLRGGARSPGARRSRSTLSTRARAPTKQMGPYHRSRACPGAAGR